MTKLFWQATIISRIAVILGILLQVAQAQIADSTDFRRSAESKLSELNASIVNLQAKIDSLQKQLNSLSPPDSAQMAKRETTPAAATSVSTVVSQETPTARQRTFQGMNPNISVVGSFIGSASDQESLARNYELELAEAEFAFQAAVDPYARADFFIGFGRHHDPAISLEADHSVGEPSPDAPLDSAAHDHSGSGTLEAEIEEAYITVLSLPLATQLRAGRYRLRFGKLNETHPHAYNLLDLPLLYQNFLGPEGLVDEGISLRWLLPNRAFFQELTVQMTGGPAEGRAFARSEGNQFLYSAHLKNFFELSDHTTLELGLAGATGPFNAAGERGSLFGVDLTIKWKPLQRNRYQSFEWLTEAVYNRRAQPAQTVNSVGFYTHLRYQLSRRWFLGALLEYSEYPSSSAHHHQAYSGILQFFATEFQKIELQPTLNTGSFFNNFWEAKLRWVFVIGAHGAHQY